VTQPKQIAAKQPPTIAQQKINNKIIIENEPVTKVAFKIVVQSFLFSNICYYLRRPLKIGGIAPMNLKIIK
jgi:hypothetical protein